MSATAHESHRNARREIGQGSEFGRAISALTGLLVDVDERARDYRMAERAYAMGARVFLAFLAERGLPRIRIEAVTTVLALDTTDARLRRFVGRSPDVAASAGDPSRVRMAAVMKALDPEVSLATLQALVDEHGPAEVQSRSFQTCVEPS